MAEQNNNDITITKLKSDLVQYTSTRMKEMEKSNTYVSSASFKSELVNYYKDILKKNENTLSDKEYNNLRSDFEKYIKQTISAYEEIAAKKATVKQKEELGANTLDLDPAFINNKAYVNGKKLKVFSDYTATNSTYSMADMVATISIETEYGIINSALGELQTISYSIYQNKTPVRNLGNMNAKDWVFGPRTIAGSLVFAVFNKHWLMELYDNLKEKAGMKNWHFISDEIPPFNITLTFANEYGFDSRMIIYGVRLMNEGQTMSTNDIYIENTYEFVATDIELMDSLRSYEQEVSRHQRGAVIAKSGDDGYDNVRKELIEEQKKAEEKEAKKDNYIKDLEFTDEQVEKMGEKVALKNLKDIKKAYLQEYKDDKEVKNGIDLIYDAQRKRIKNYFKAKKAAEKEALKKKKEEEKNKNSDG